MLILKDNTNPDLPVRSQYIAIAKKYNATPRCLYFSASPELCQHNDAVRGLGGELVNPDKREMLPKIAFTGYTSRFEEPKEEEGFVKVETVEFEVCFWDSVKFVG
jgi:bifunctional polynucleotide phosphatase/kinase